MAAGRVYDNAGWLVDDKQLFIFVSNPKISGSAGVAPYFAQVSFVYFDHSACLWLRRLRRRRSIDSHLAGRDQSLRACARTERFGQN